MPVAYRFSSKCVGFVFIALLAASYCPAAESIVLQNGATVSGTFPVNPVFNSIGDIRIEFRLHNYSIPVDYYGFIFNFGPLSARIFTGVAILNLTDNSYNPDSKSFANLDLTGRATDVLVRFQKDEENQRLTLEAWNADGTGYIFESTPRSTFKSVNVSGTPMVLGAATTMTDLAYLRLYSTVLPLNSPPPSMTSGDLADWEFEGNLNDKSGHGVNLGGPISYVPTPSYPINVTFGQYGSQRVWSADHGSILLDASSTYSSVDDPHYTYTWSQISGPATGSFSAPNAITASFSAFLPGDYQIRLTASDGVTSNSMDVDVGAVNTDDKGIVQTGNPSMDIALGPLSMWGTSPWPWYDFTEMADADALYPLVTQPPVFGQTPLSGTLTVVNGNSIVTGVGTNFYKDLTDCDPSSGSGSAYTCSSNVPYSSLSDIGLRDRYFIPDVNCSGAPTLNVNSTMALAVYTSGTNSPASCTAGTVYQISLQGCLTSGGSTCSGGVQWTGSTAFTGGSTVLDSTYHVHYATAGGTSGATVPAWNDSGGTTTDGTVTWQDKGLAFYTIQPGYPFIWFWWNAPDGPGTGRIPLPISTINSPTSLTLYYYGGYIGPTSSGIQYSNPSAPELETYWNLTGQPSNSLNYYDVVHALYKLYYRTSLTRYLTEARTFADNWYQFGTAQGYYSGAPRAMSYLGMVDRAIDGHPTIWKALDEYFSNSLQLANFQFTTPQSVGFQFDTRETGYAVRYMARMAALDPDPGWHTTACSYLHNVVANVYHAAQDSLGQWEVDGYSENADGPGAKYQGRFGSSPWRDAMSGLALEESYDILANNCGDSATAALALTTVTSEANFTHDYGEGQSSFGSGVGQFANVMYGSMFATNLHASYLVNSGQYILPNTTGTLAVTEGSAVVAGTGTNFTQIFPVIYHGGTPQPGIDAAFIAIPGLYSSSCSQVLPVASVTDDTHLTLSSSWPCASASNINANGFGWIGTPPAAVNCASYGSIAATCEGPVDPSLTHEVHAMWSWLYWKTGNSKYLTWAQESAGTDYGGSAGGPGSPLPPGGPFATGYTGNFMEALPQCGTEPCGGYGPAAALGKDFGFSAGAGNANNAMAYMLMGASATPVTPPVVSPSTPPVITPTVQTITFATLNSVPANTAPFLLSAAASSGLPISFASTTPAVCTISGSTVTIIGAGTCSVTANQAGNASYAAATPVVQGFTATAAAQTITFGFLSSIAANAAPFTVSATAGSGLPVSFTSTTTAVCTISGNTVTIVGAGTCSITASQAGNASYAAAASVTQGFTATPVPGVMTAAPSSLNYAYQLGDSNVPSVQSISVFDKFAATNFTATASSSGNWLSAGTGGVTPGSVAVSVDVGKLGAGTATGQVTISSATNQSVVVPVTIAVAKAGSAVLSVSPATESLSLAQGSARASGQVTVTNSGGGTLQFTAQAASDQGWLATPNGPGSATPSAPASLAFTVDPSGLNPGLYSGSITVHDLNSASQAAVAVILTVTNTEQSISLSQTGLMLTAVAGGAQPPGQSFTVANSGAGTLKWTAETNTLAGGAWMSVSPGSGSTAGGQAGAAVSVLANSAGLSPGQYYGSVNVAAEDAANGPQAVSVVLNVVASQANPGETVSTGGVILAGPAGSSTPAQRSISVFNPSLSAINYAVSTFTADGTGWLSVIPQVAAANPGANPVQIAANLKGLAAGVQTGTVRFAFDDGSVTTIQVVALSTGSGSPAATASAARRATPVALQGLTACLGGKASFLIPVIQQPVNQVVQVGAPETLQAEVIDDCGNPVTANDGGSVQVTFSSGDSGADLHDVGSGIWEATWTPVNAANQVKLQVAASEQGLTLNPSLSAANALIVMVQGASADSAAQPTGIANAASAGQAMPLVVAPGSYVSIYGTGLSAAGNVVASSLPLPTMLDGTQVFLGGQPMPLFYTSAGQVNALVPQGLAPNASDSLIVLRGTTLSVPVSVTITGLQPGIYSANSSGSGAGVVTNARTGQLNTAANPANGLDYLTIYCTGLGPVTGTHGETEPADGTAAPFNTIFSTIANVTAMIGGVAAPVQFSGLTPGFVGLYQVNVQVPAGVSPGGNIPLVVTATDPLTGASVSSNSVSVAVQ